MDLDKFYASPSESLFDKFTKEQLRKVAEHYQLTDLPRDLKKEVLKNRVRSVLVERSIMEVIPSGTNPNGSDEVFISDKNAVSFEQQMQLLKLQMEQKRFEAAEREHQREKNREMELKRLESVLEQKRLDIELEMEKMKRQERQEERESELQREKLRLVAEGKMRDTVNEDSGSGIGGNISSMLKFLPKFNDRDPDIFFSLFEGIAEERNWSDLERTLLLQTVLSGRARDAYVALSVTERKSYQSVKNAVLRVYEQVPEFYRQRFRNWRKADSQTYSEVARDLVSYFVRWCSAVNVKTFEQLGELVVLEQFKNIVPEHLAIFINDHKVKTAAEAAILSDEYALTHKGKT